MIQRKKVVDSIIHRVEPSYLEKLKASGTAFSLATVRGANAILEYVDANDAGEQFFKDHYVTIQTSTDSGLQLIPGASYRVITCSNGCIGLRDDYFISERDAHFDLVSPGRVQLTDGPAVIKIDYEQALKRLIAGPLGQPSNALKKVLLDARNSLGSGPSTISIRDRINDIIFLLESHPYIEVKVEATLEAQMKAERQ